MVGGSPAFCQRQIKRSSLRPLLFFKCKNAAFSFFGTIRIPNPDTPRARPGTAGHVRPRRGGAGRRGKAGQRRGGAVLEVSSEARTNEVLCKLSCRIQSQHIPRACRVGAAHGGAAGRGGSGQDGTPTDRFAQETTVPRTLQGIEQTCPERLFRSTNKRNPI